MIRDTATIRKRVGAGRRVGGDKHISFLFLFLLSHIIISMMSTGSVVAAARRIPSLFLHSPSSSSTSSKSGLLLSSSSSSNIIRANNNNRRMGITRTVGTFTTATSKQKLSLINNNDNNNSRNNCLWRSSTSCFLSTTNDNDNDNDNNNNELEKPKKGKRVSGFKNYIINPNLDSDNKGTTNKLTEAFDDLAKKDGFDSSTSYFAADDTFDDDFNDDDYALYLKNQAKIQSEGEMSEDEAKVIAGKIEEDLESDEDYEYMDFGEGGEDAGGDGDNMEARISAAQSNLGFEDVKTEDFRNLGFKKELNPFEGDETKRNEEFAQLSLVVDELVCVACGSDFQCRDEKKPGYLPAEKFDVQVNLSKVQRIIKLQKKAEKSMDEWTTDDEIDWLIQGGGQQQVDNAKEKMSSVVDINAPKNDKTNFYSAADVDINDLATELGVNLDEMNSSGANKKKTVCKRCHGLQNFGIVDNSLRPGWTKESTLSQEKFLNLLKPLRDKKAIIIVIVDVFDFAGSILPELDTIAGDNPVIVAANKADLLPTKTGQQRVENWVRGELEYMGIQSLANIGGAVRLISAKNGMGVHAMLIKAKKLSAMHENCDIYVVGAANAGKSTLMNSLLGRQKTDEERKEQLNQKKSQKQKNNKKVRAGNRNQFKGALTTSPLPGTTLKFIKVDLGDGLSLYDTPGLLVPGTLTQLLTPEELKIAVPNKQVEPITFRVATGKCVLVGGLAKVRIVGDDTKPFLLTFFVANGIKLHPTDSSRADEFVKKHIGTDRLSPPFLREGDKKDDLLRSITEKTKTHKIKVEGAGWKTAAADITLTGLGWIAVTGAGTAKIEIEVPEDIQLTVRPPLMPFDMWETTAKYTGGRAVRKSSKSATGKRRKGVGRR